MCSLQQRQQWERRHFWCVMFLWHYTNFDAHVWVHVSPDDSDCSFIHLDVRQSRERKRSSETEWAWERVRERSRIIIMKNETIDKRNTNTQTIKPKKCERKRLRNEEEEEEVQPNWLILILFSFFSSVCARFLFEWAAANSLRLFLGNLATRCVIVSSHFERKSYAVSVRALLNDLSNGCWCRIRKPI